MNLLIGRVATLAVPLALGFTLSCAKAPLITEPFSDTFDRAELGPAFHDTGGGFALVDGKLSVKGAYNHPLWLRKRLPANVSVEFDVVSSSPAGDIKFEMFGDGKTFDPDKGAYLASGYVLIFGGWNNTLSVICRQNEHNEGVKAQRPDPRVEVGRSYHMTVTRNIRKVNGKEVGQIEWRVDGAPFLSWDDPEPFAGPDHEFFAFNNWEADVRFDNLLIKPL